MENKFREEYIENHFEEQTYKLYLESIQYFTGIFKTNNIPLLKTYSIQEQIYLFDSKLKNYKQQFVCHYKFEKEVAGVQILETLAYARFAIELAFWKNTAEICICRECGTLINEPENYHEFLDYYDELCSYCRRKHKLKVNLFFSEFKQYVNHNPKKMSEWMKIETNLGIIYPERYYTYLSEVTEERKVYEEKKE